MKGLRLASVVFVGGLTACARADGIDGSNSGGLLFLLLVGVVLYCGVVALLWRRVRISPRSGPHRRRRPGPDSETERSVAAIAAIAERWRAGLAEAVHREPAVVGNKVKSDSDDARPQPMG
jgi:hypothetical protein